MVRDRLGTGLGGQASWGGSKLLAAHCNRAAGLAWQTKAEPNAGKLSLLGDDGAALNYNHLVHEQHLATTSLVTGALGALVWIPVCMNDMESTHPSILHHHHVTMRWDDVDEYGQPSRPTAGR